MNAELTETEAIKMRQWTREDLQAGKITAEAAERAFADLGTTLQDQMKPDSRNEEVKVLDAAFPPAKPNDYIINWGLPASPELKAADESARTWLSSAGFDQQLGNSLVNTIEQVARQTKNMTDQQLEKFKDTEWERLRQVYGKELESRLSEAGRMVEEIERQRPGLKNMLQSKGLGDSSLVSSLLIQQAERYWIRRKK
jgi:hypothetical protein